MAFEWLKKRPTFILKEPLIKRLEELRGLSPVTNQEIQNNFLVTVRKLLGIEPHGKRKSLCFACGQPFEEIEENYHPECDTWKCPRCGKCFCDLSPEAQRALDAEMTSLGLWDVYANPKRRKRRKSPARKWLEDYWAKNYPHLTFEEFVSKVARGEITVPPVPAEYY